MDTIFAEATPPGRGGVSIMRISGSDARRVTEALCGGLPEARYCYLRAVRDGDELIDNALVIRFDDGASFTGEASCEIQLHGAPVVVRRLEAALRKHGLRQAEPGEFTMRAFISGQMDLAEVEGLSDLLSAETEAQRRQAVAVSAGALGRLADEWRQDLIAAGALITASIDFADEEIPEDVAAGVDDIVARVRRSVSDQLAGFPASERLRMGFEVALVGAPNAGKSSLMNAIARRDIAIVSDQAGTTRDIVEFRADLRGLPVIFLDTAGLREAEDAVESIGVSRAYERAKDADLRIFLGDIPAEARDLVRESDLFVETRGDLTGDATAISSVTGQGVDGLLDRVFLVLRDRVARAGLASHERQAGSLVDAQAALDLPDGVAVEILSEQLREAIHHLERLVGKIDVEDYLDQVFSNFCVGK